MYVYKRNTLSPPIPITSPCHAVGPDARARRRRRTRRAPPNDRAIDRSIGDDDDDGDGGDAPRGDGRRPARVRTPTRHGFAGHGLDDEKMRERQDARERRSQDGVRVVGASVRGCVRFDCDSLRSRRVTTRGENGPNACFARDAGWARAWFRARRCDSFIRSRAREERPYRRGRGIARADDE